MLYLHELNESQYLLWWKKKKKYVNNWRRSELHKKKADF